MKRVKKQLKNRKGQAMTEFLLVLMVLIAIILVHAQFSLGYVAASFFRYASFMTARAEAVNPGTGQIYKDALIGDSANNKLRAIASLKEPEGSAIAAPLPDQIEKRRVKIDYQMIRYVPLIGELGEALTSHSAQSVFIPEPYPIQGRSE